MNQRWQVKVSVEQVKWRTQDAEASQCTESVGAMGLIGWGTANAAFKGLACGRSSGLSFCGYTVICTENNESKDQNRTHNLISTQATGQ